VLRLITRTAPHLRAEDNRDPFARHTTIRQEGYPPAKRRDREIDTRKGGVFRAPPVSNRFMIRVLNTTEPNAGSAQSAQPERPFPASARIRVTFGLLAGARELFHRIVAFANRGSELFAKTFRGLAKVVAALGSSFGKRRIGKMRPVAHPGPVFLKLNLPLEIGGHLVEFANDPFEIFDFPRLFFDLTALQKHGRFT
jgi:hypothetical protein